MLKYSGFSLLEMLVVLVIIGLLAGLVGPRLMGNLDSSMVKTADTQVKMLKGVLQTMRLDIGRYPNTQEGLAMLSSNVGDQSNWAGPYLEEALPQDPWGNAYQYVLEPSINGQPFSLYSFGADGKSGGEGNNADIGYLPK